MRLSSRAAVAAVLLALISVRLAAADFPQHAGYVNDFAGLLSEPARASLETLLRQAEQDTTAEIVLATVPSLDGMTVEEYANRLFQEWGIGKKKVDNGVLVLVAPNEREMRIEVGYGLEPILPDGLAGEIIRVNFLPRFREDDYPGGIESGVARVVDVVKRNHVLTADERKAIEDAAQERAPWYLTIPFFGAFIGIGFFMIGVGLGSKTGFPLLFGSLFGGIPLLMSMIPLMAAPIYIMGPFALAAAVMGFRSGRRRPGWVTDMRGTGSRGSSRSSGWVMGGGSGGSSGGGHSSSGSSFGGGSSGGGGASGRW